MRGIAWVASSLLIGSFGAYIGATHRSDVGLFDRVLLTGVWSGLFLALIAGALALIFPNWAPARIKKVSVLHGGTHIRAKSIYVSVVGGVFILPFLIFFGVVIAYRPDLVLPERMTAPGDPNLLHLFFGAFCILFAIYKLVVIFKRGGSSFEISHSNFRVQHGSSWTYEETWRGIDSISIVGVEKAHLEVRSSGLGSRISTNVQPVPSFLFPELDAASWEELLSGVPVPIRKFSNQRQFQAAMKQIP